MIRIRQRLAGFQLLEKVSFQFVFAVTFACLVFSYPVPRVVMHALFPARLAGPWVQARHAWPSATGFCWYQPGGSEKQEVSE